MKSRNSQLTPKIFIGGAAFGGLIRVAWVLLQRQSIPGFSNLSSENLAPQTIGFLLTASFLGYGLLYFGLALSNLRTEKDFVYRASENLGWFDKVAFSLLSVTAGQFLASAVIGIMSWVSFLRAESAYRFVTDLLVVLLCIFLSLMLPSFWFTLNRNDVRDAGLADAKGKQRWVSFFAEVIIAGLLCLTGLDIFSVMMNAS